MPDYLSQKALAERLGLTSRQVHNLAEAGLPKRSRAGKVTYPWPDALRWYIEFKVRSTQQRAGGEADFEKARARKMEADAQLAELALAERRADLIPARVHETRVAALAERLAAVCKGGLSRYLGDVQRALTAAEAATVLERVGDDLLRALRGQADDLEDEVAGDEMDAEDGDDAGNDGDDGTRPAA